jgi:hypothetical protein
VLAGMIRVNSVTGNRKIRMTEEILYGLPQWLIGLVTLALLVLSVEVGYRIGLRANIEMTQPMKAQISTIQTAILTIFTFLLGFTFAMALSRSITGNRWWSRSPTPSARRYCGQNCFRKISGPG